jgi:hypothetical protein
VSRRLLLIRKRLEASQFTSTREQRRAIHRLNNYVLGTEYKRKAAMLAPISREYDDFPFRHVLRYLILTGANVKSGTSSIFSMRYI